MGGREDISGEFIFHCTGFLIFYLSWDYILREVLGGFCARGYLWLGGELWREMYCMDGWMGRMGWDGLLVSGGFSAMRRTGGKGSEGNTDGWTASGRGKCASWGVMRFVVGWVGLAGWVGLVRGIWDGGWFMVVFFLFLRSLSMLVTLLYDLLCLYLSELRTLSTYLCFA